MDENTLREKVACLLEKIEFRGPADYSIGVPTCPCCGAFRTSKYNESGQHRDGCLLKEIFDECYYFKPIQLPVLKCDTVSDKILSVCPFNNGE